MDSLIRKAILEVMPVDGSGIGSQKLAETVMTKIAENGKTATPAEVQRIKEALIDEGLLGKGRGRGGSVYLARPTDDGGTLVLTTPPQPGELTLSTRPVSSKPKAGVYRQRVNDGDAAEILSYRHPDKRKNNPEVGMVKPENDPAEPGSRWCYDPHIDPALQFDFGRAGVEKLIDDALASGDESVMRTALEELKRYSAPYLNWTGKAERTSFEVDTVSLHVHERIDPASILSAVRKAMAPSPGAGAPPSPARGRGAGGEGVWRQPDLFAAPFENLPLRDAIDFYKHERGWANRLIAGDSLLVMNSLLQKESLAGQVQMIYIDRPTASSTAPTSSPSSTSAT